MQDVNKNLRGDENEWKSKNEKYNWCLLRKLEFTPLNFWRNNKNDKNKSNANARNNMLKTSSLGLCLPTSFRVYKRSVCGYKLVSIAGRKKQLCKTQARARKKTAVWLWEKQGGFSLTCPIRLGNKRDK